MRDCVSLVCVTLSLTHRNWWGCGSVCNSVSVRDGECDCLVEPLGVCRGRFRLGELKSEFNFGDLLYETEYKMTNTKESLK